MTCADVAYRDDRGFGREAVTAFTPVSPFLLTGTAQERMPEILEFRGGLLHNPYAPLWTIPSKTKIYKVSKPIKVRIYQEENFWFVENETLVIAGTGNSREEAIDDFCRHIIHFHKYYKKLPANKVIGDAVRLKKIFETLFSE